MGVLTLHEGSLSLEATAFTPLGTLPACSLMSAGEREAEQGQTCNNNALLLRRRPTLHTNPHTTSINAMAYVDTEREVLYRNASISSVSPEGDDDGDVDEDIADEQAAAGKEVDRKKTRPSTRSFRFWLLVFAYGGIVLCVDRRKIMHTHIKTVEPFH